MRIQEYREKKTLLKMQEAQHSYRGFCKCCWQPDFNCYCHALLPFDPCIEFVILIHPIEARRRIATGRMAYLSLSRARIFRGTEFGQDPRITELIADTRYSSMILARGLESVDISCMHSGEKKIRFGAKKRLRIFLLDGTWSNARSMVTRSPNLQKLPQICFTPKIPSKICVRKQPNPQCYTTLEAIHYVIDTLGEAQGFDVNSRMHDNLFSPFHWMVQAQLERLKKGKKRRFIHKRPRQSESEVPII